MVEGLTTDNRDFNISVGGKTEVWTEVIFSGRIDASTIDQFMGGFDDQLERDQNQIVLNLDGVDYITSTGLGGLIKYHNLFEEDGGCMVLIEPPEVVMSVLSLLGFQDVLNLVDDIETFVESKGGTMVEINEFDIDAIANDQDIEEETKLTTIFNPSKTSQLSDHAMLEHTGLDIETFANGNGNGKTMALPNAAVAVPTKKKTSGSAKLKKLQYDQQRKINGLKPEKIVRQKSTTVLPDIDVSDNSTKKSKKKSLNEVSQEIDEEITISAPKKKKKKIPAPKSEAKPIKKESKNKKTKIDASPEAEETQSKKKKSEKIHQEERLEKKAKKTKANRSQTLAKTEPENQEKKKKKGKPKSPKSKQAKPNSVPLETKKKSKKKARIRVIDPMEDLDDDLIIEPDFLPEHENKAKESKKLRKTSRREAIEEDDIDEDEEEDIKTPSISMVFISAFILCLVSGLAGFAYYMYAPQKEDFKIQLLTMVGVGVLLPAILIYVIIKIRSISRLKAELEEEEFDEDEDHDE